MKEGEKESVFRKAGRAATGTAGILILWGAPMVFPEVDATQNYELSLNRFVVGGAVFLAGAALSALVAEICFTTGERRERADSRSKR